MQVLGEMNKLTQAQADHSGELAEVHVESCRIILGLWGRVSDGPRVELAAG
jgi:hypothetical protein